MTETEQDSVYYGAMNPNQFVMGFNMLPKLSRPKNIKDRRRSPKNLSKLDNWGEATDPANFKKNKLG